MNRRFVIEDDWFDRPMPPNVVIGEGCYIHSAYSFLHYRSRRECGVQVGRYTGVYFETFFDVGPEGYVQVGDYCTLAGPIISTNGQVIIGSYVLISREVILADGMFAGPPRDERESLRADFHADGGGRIVVGDDAWIGTRAVLLAGAVVGHGAIVGAGSVVNFEVPPYAVVAGHPAQVVGRAPPRKQSSSSETSA